MSATQATVYPHLKDPSSCKSQIFSDLLFCCSLSLKNYPTPSPLPKKLSPPIQPSQSPNRIDNDLKGNKKIVSLWQAEGEICRLHVRICYVTKGHTGSLVLNSTSKKYTPKGQNKKKIPQESITQNKFQISLLLQKETKKAQLT